MKKIVFSQHVLPHLVALVVFVVVLVFFFSPVFFDNKALDQHDIQQWAGSSKALRDYREQTGEQGLWVETMFSGMPSYLVSLQWSNSVVGVLKRVVTVGMPSPVANIMGAFVSFYIMLLVFGVRPYLAITGAIAFGLSSYMAIGVLAGHNARIGAIAFMPLVIAGVHLAYNGLRILAFGVTAAGLALQLRENHLQITYYLLIILGVYALVQWVYAWRAKTIKNFLTSSACLVGAALIAVATFVGPLWGVTEYTRYSIRGKSELQSPTRASSDTEALSKDYAFNYSNGFAETFTLLVPNIVGGASSNFLVMDQKSNTYRALAGSGNEQVANQLANYTSAYWGNQPLSAPYYAGAIIVLLFAIGVACAERKYVWWLVPLALLGIMLAWGSNFKSLNYFLFDYLPGYNKFRSVTFALILPLLAMPLLGMLGLERLWKQGTTAADRKKMLIAGSIVAGLCLLFIVGKNIFFSFTREGEDQLPAWFVDALIEDRQGLLQGDAFRSFLFILPVFVFIYFEWYKKLSPVIFYGGLAFLTLVDLAAVDKRYITRENFKSKREQNTFAATEADQAILKDKDYYRVYNLQDPMNEARTSYFHNSLGGYHGAKLRRYNDLYDSCLFRETNVLIQDAQSGRLDFNQYGIINMLNARYLVYGPGRDNIIRNPAANGNAWFVQTIKSVNNPTEELKATGEINTRTTAVVDASRFKVSTPAFDSTATIALKQHNPNQLTYESVSNQAGFAVFSEIYYEKGWKAFIDDSPAPIVRANYVLRALEVPAGKHTITFRFEPEAYYTGNTITLMASWLMLLVLLGSVGWSLKK